MKNFSFSTLSSVTVAKCSSGVVGDWGMTKNMFMQSVCESASINCDNLVKTTNLLVSAWIEILAVICKPSPVCLRAIAISPNQTVIIWRKVAWPVQSLWLKLVTNPDFLQMFVLKFRSVCLYRLFLNAVVMQSKLWDQNEDRVWSYTSLVSGAIGRWSINALKSMLTETVTKLCNM